MKKSLSWIGFFIALVFSLSMFTGCAEKKAVVKEGAAQDQQIVADKYETLKEWEAYRLAKEQAEKEAADRLAGEQAEKGQVAKVEAAATAATAVVESSVKDIYFDFDKSNIRSDAREVLKANADYFLKNRAASIVVEGHCDERGTAEYNMALGQRRAREAKNYLVNLGIKESKIKTISYGKERPVDSGSDEQAWAKNRRDHFVVVNVK